MKNKEIRQEVFSKLNSYFTINTNDVGNVNINMKYVKKKNHSALLNVLKELGLLYDDTSEEKAIDSFLIRLEKYLSIGCEKDDFRYAHYVISVLDFHIGTETPEVVLEEDYWDEVGSIYDYDEEHYGSLHEQY